ncbi:MAG: kelch repeat-containing protein [Planctomycetota bacterium]
MPARSLPIVGLVPALLLMLLVGSPWHARSESVATGSFAAGPRGEHAAVALPDGRVVAFGGLGPTSGYPHGTFEIFDPQTAAWSVHASLPVGRRLATMTRLADGRLFVVGGSSGPATFADTALLDVEAGTPPSAGASMSTPRSGHTATRLLDGRVLVAGGIATTVGPVALATAEVYDPATGVWTGVGPMTTARSLHAAVRLADGRVLLAGGDLGSANGFVGRTVCEVFDPTSGTFGAVAPMTTARANFGLLALSDGRILAVGGNKNASGSPVLAAEVFDPMAGAAGAWTSLGPIACGGSSPALAALPDGRVLVSGGWAGSGLPYDVAQIFDPAQDAFGPPQALLMGRAHHTTTVLPDGRVLVAGGLASPTVPNFTATCELLTVPALDTPPVASAGPDVGVRPGDVVVLDGSASFDDNTAAQDLELAWTLVSRPADSSASLSDAHTAAPYFTADRVGTYVVQLVVMDELGQASAPDTVQISSLNLPPMADAGPDLVVVAGRTLTLAGVADDPDDDPVSTTWMIVERPADSTAYLVDSDTLTPSLTPDVSGSFELELIVEDPFGEQAVDRVVVTAIQADEAAAELLAEASDVLAGLPDCAFAAPGLQTAFLRLLGRIQVALARGDGTGLAMARIGLRLLLTRTDGVPIRGLVDVRGPGRDWIVDPGAQDAIYVLLEEALDLLAA